MKTVTRSILVLSLAALLSAPALGAQGTAKPLDLAGAMELIARTYPGRVISGQTDAAGGDRLHHHVDVLLANGRVAKFDVDAATQRIYNRLPPEEGATPGLSLEQAVRKMQQAKGPVVSAEYDPDPAPHYHMTVRSTKGLARIDVDPATGQATPHKPRI